MNTRPMKEKLGDSINTIVLTCIALTMMLPFVYIFAVSFSSLEDHLRHELLLWPKRWVLDSYEYIMNSEPFVRSLIVTIGVTVVGTVVNLLFTATMAYGLTRSIAGQRMILFMVLFTLLFSAGMIPTYLVVKETGLLDSLWSLILPAAIAPFNLIVVRQFFLNIPEELNEAAMIDGANELKTFVSVILPLSKPVMAAFSLFYAVGHWNSYFNGILYLNDPSKWPIQVILRQIVVMNDTMNTLGEADIELMTAPPPPETIQMAAILVATVPILLVYPFLQKYFAKGVLIGSVKG